MNDTEKDDFASAFAEAIAADTKPKGGDEPEEKVGSEAAEPVVAAKVDEPAAEPVVAAKVDEPAAEPVVAAKADETPAEPAPVVAKRPAPRAEPIEQPAPAARHEEAPLELRDPVLTADQTKLLDNFKKEWPDIAAAQETQLQHATAQIQMQFARALTTLIEQVYGDITPMATMYADVAQDDHRTSIVGKHEDFDEIAPKLKPWIDSQPGYLRKSFNEVYDNGTAEEIVDLVQRFKDANGVRPQLTSPTPTQPQVSQKKVAALAPVGGKRSVVATKGADPNDYKGAFAEALDSL